MQTSLDFVGRNHGNPKSYGSVPGTTVAADCNSDLRQTNFLYVDGHVETKNLVDTLYPKFQWGDRCTPCKTEQSMNLEGPK